MKITSKQLRQIIREEVSRVTTEQKDFDDLERHEAEPENEENEKGKKLMIMLGRAVNYSGHNLATDDSKLDQSTALNNIIMAAGRALVAMDSNNDEELSNQLSYIDSELEDASR